MTTYDYIIIGGGVAGLYSAYKLSKKYKVLVLEKENYLGGRVQEVKFHGNTIKLGAGIASKGNRHLLKLLDMLNIKYSSAKGNINVINDSDYYNKTYHNNMIKQVKEKVKELTNKKINYGHLTFKQFMYKYFNKKDVDNYFLHSEYNDYLDGDVNYHMKYYPISDNLFTPYIILYLSWSELINKLKQPSVEYKINTPVINIKKDNDMFIVNNKYKANKLIFAVTIHPLIKLIKNLTDIDYSKYIGSVPFVRIYSYHKNGHNFTKEGYTILANNNPLSKVITITDRTLMDSYSDSKYAEYWKKYINNKDKDKLIKRVQSCLEEVDHNVSKIDDIYIKYWNTGVHYFHPLGNRDIKKTLTYLANPAENIQVVGELISLKQGWVEGAIESVDRILSMY